LVEARKKWKRFAGAGILVTFLNVVVGAIGLAVGFGIPFAILALSFGINTMTVAISVFVGVLVGFAAFGWVNVSLMLTAPIVMMEDSGVRSAMRRSMSLMRRSFATAAAAFIIMFLVPVISAGTISAVVTFAARSFDKPEVENPSNAPVVENAVPFEQAEQKEERVQVDLGRFGAKVSDSTRERNPVKYALLDSLLQIILLPLQIIITSFTSIIVALLYLNTRQAGGEPLADIWTKFELADQPKKKWQERVRQRLIQSGRISGTSKS
jgi:hypothetical protein